MMTLLIHRIQEIVMKKLFKEALEDSPIIAAVKDDEGLSRCLTSDSRIIFILYGDIVTISDIVETVKSAGKLATALSQRSRHLSNAPRSWGSLQSSGCF